MGKIEWENRLVNDNGSLCTISVDGTDCRIQEPSPFNPKWYSYEFKGPGVRYEVGVGLQTGWIVWVNGPYPCGAWADLKIARDLFVQALAPGETYVADGMVHAEAATGLNANDDQEMMNLARARHETVNCRLQRFGVLSQVFRHGSTEKHALCFHSIANIIQIELILDK